MIKQTLFFANPAYLSTMNEQLFVSFPEPEKATQTIPIEDVGYVVLESTQITITSGLLSKLMENKTAVITCDKKHMPCSFLQPLVGHSEQSERIRHQLEASKPLKKNLWQQTIVAKIRNQATHLDRQGKNALKLYRWANQVKSGDAGNHEAISAAHYFKNIFNLEGFTRHQYGDPPNNLLNYGYAILRAVTARALISSGMLPSVGIFHKNKYNAFCLADDIMEPYRIYVDDLVVSLLDCEEDCSELTTSMKIKLLKIPVMDVWIDGKKSPLMNAMSRTTASLHECFAGYSRKLLFPIYD